MLEENEPYSSLSSGSLLPKRESDMDLIPIPSFFASLLMETE